MVILHTNELVNPEANLVPSKSTHAKIAVTVIWFRYWKKLQCQKLIPLKD